jgi:hypothetical protein
MWWRQIPRRRRVAIVTVSVVLLVVVGGLLAQFLSTENVERGDILTVLQAQARGDSARELALLDGCRHSPSCATTVRTSARGLRRPGAVKILSLKAATAYHLSSVTGMTRVAWTVIGREPVVQCLRVRRTGSFLRGMTVTLLSLSAPIANEGYC